MEEQPSTSNQIKNLPNDLRPREDLIRNGADTMSPEKLIALILRSGLRGSNVIQVAEKLIKKAGGLKALSELSYAEIKALGIPGIGKVKAIELNAVFAIAKHLQKENSKIKDQRFTQPEDIYNLMLPYIQNKPNEGLYIVLLNNKNVIIDKPIQIGEGVSNKVITTPSEIFRPAIRHGATRIILVHNHPTGDPTPSRDDIFLTQSILEASKTMMIPLVDHIIISGIPIQGMPPYYSIRQNALINF